MRMRDHGSRGIPQQENNCLLTLLVVQVTQDMVRSLLYPEVGVAHASGAVLVVLFIDGRMAHDILSDTGFSSPVICFWLFSTVPHSTICVAGDVIKMHPHREYFATAHTTVSTYTCILIATTIGFYACAVTEGFLKLKSSSSHSF